MSDEPQSLLAARFYAMMMDPERATEATLWIVAPVILGVAGLAYLSIHGYLPNFVQT